MAKLYEKRLPTIVLLYLVEQEQNGFERQPVQLEVLDKKTQEMSEKFPLKEQRKQNEKVEEMATFADEDKTQ